jgi:D-alanyl-D-alanine-carboxypeptidase/D-alanyl-D-alanine-endopeptidase
LARTPSIAPPERSSEEAILATLRDKVETMRQSVGIVAGVADNSGRKIVTYGHSGPVDARPLDGDTVFEIGSITKVFTALLLAEMSARNEIALDDPVAKYLPKEVKAPARGRKRITLIQLAAYTSGLPRMPSNFNPKNRHNPYADYTIDQLYEFLSEHKLRFDPGSHYEYSNLGFGLLGHVLALAAGKTYEDLIVARICAPLNMSSTRLKLTASMRQRLAQGHNSILEPASNWDLPTLAGAGGLKSSAHDLFTFLSVVSNRQLDTPLAHASQRLLKTQCAAGERGNAALGWFLKTRAEDVIVYKTGGTGGYRSFIGFSAWSGRTSVVLSNAANDADDVGLNLVNCGYPLKQYPPQIEIESSILTTYAGIYAMSPGFTLTIRASEKRLFVRGSGQDEYELFADAETRFFMRAVDAQAIFVREIDGGVRQLIWHQGGGYQYCPRLS